jgi:hypothetical protein
MKYHDIRLVVALVIAAFWVAAPVAADDPQRVEFEGYLFRDVDGKPLPTQSDEAIEELLKTAKVISMKKIPVGVTRPRKLVLADDGRQVHASFKDIDQTKYKMRDRGPGGNMVYREWRDWYGYDIAAYRLDRLLGLYRVPPTVERREGSAVGSVSIWLEGTLPERVRQGKEIQPPEYARFNQQKQILRVLDNLIANRDSNLGNILIDSNWRLWFIDFSRSFGTSKELIYPEEVTHCDRQVLQALRDLDRDAVRERLGEFLTKFEIDALMARRDRLVEHIDGLIEERGAELVLFNNRPPTEKAPWAVD